MTFKRLDLDKSALKRLLEGDKGVGMLAVAKAAQTVERRAKQNAPVRTGTLRRSITKAIGRDAISPVAKIGTNVHYARFVEFGTSRMSPRPFLRRALEGLRRSP
jgi:HK97 gp10 family phage protein